MSGRLAYSPAQPTPSSAPQCQQIWATDSGRIILSGGDRYESFGPLEQVKALHPAGPNGKAAGTVTLVQMTSEGWQEWSVRASEAPQMAQDLLTRPDTRNLFVGHQRFRGRRRSALLLGLASLYCDIDYHASAAWAGRSARDVLIEALMMLRSQLIPPPSYALDTGRGLLLVWLHEYLPEKARTRWAAVEKRLVGALAELGADSKATDVARVFRIVGSINPKADPARSRVGMVWCLGDPASPDRYIFDDLANEVLPFTRAALHSLAAEKALRREQRVAGRNGSSAGPKRLTQATWGQQLLADLEALRYHRHPGGRIPSGHRDAWLLLAAVAISWTCPPEALEATMERLAASAGGWTSTETKARLSAILKRARQAASGETVSYKGKQVDPRYRYRSRTMIELLGVSDDEQEAAGLRLLISGDRKRAIAADRVRKCRDGRRKRPGHAEARQQRLEIGQKALYLQAKWGSTRDELAATLQVSAGLLSKAVNEAREYRARLDQAA